MVVWVQFSKFLYFAVKKKKTKKTDGHLGTTVNFRIVL